MGFKLKINATVTVQCCSTACYYSFIYLFIHFLYSLSISWCTFHSWLPVLKKRKKVLTGLDGSALDFIFHIYEVICQQMQSPSPRRSPRTPGCWQKRGRRQVAGGPALPLKLKKPARNKVERRGKWARTSATFWNSPAGLCSLWPGWRVCALRGSFRKYWLMGLIVHSNLLRLIRAGGKWGGWVPMFYYLLTTLSPPEWLCIEAGSCVRHFDVSLIVRAKSQDGVREP